MQGVIDRIEDGIAVILIETEGTEWAVDETSLPVGAIEGTILQLEKNNGTYEIISIDEDATNTAIDKANTLQNKLQTKKKRSKFKRR